MTWRNWSRTAPTWWFTVTDDEPTEPEEGEERVAGAFDPETKTIYLAPDLVEDEEERDDAEE